jgi:holo-[acyl-carrier protein] synthase
MILGVGVECVEVPRFEAALQRYGARLERRLFTSGERDYAAGRRRAQSLAVRFAAKVAASRALGLVAPRFQELEVVRSAPGAPQLLLRGGALRLAGERGVRRVTLSLTHDRQLCVGHVILEDGE